MSKDTSLFVRKLAHNNDTVRRQAFQALKSFLQSKSSSQLSLLEYEKLWKGLYYSMWFCDKPIPQQALAHDLGTLFSEYVPQGSLARFHTAFWDILCREWYSIDKWRIDKYMMLVRRVVRHMLFRLQANGWKEEELNEFLAVLFESLFSDKPKTPPGLGYHVCDLFLDEIEYVVLKDFRDYSEEITEDDENSDDESDSDDDSDVAEQGETTEPENKETDAETDAKKAKVLSEAPLAQMVAPFQKLADTTKSASLKKKITEEILDDDRLVQWGVTEAVAEESEDEWTGF